MLNNQNINKSSHKKQELKPEDFFNGQYWLDEVDQLPDMVKENEAYFEKIKDGKAGMIEGQKTSLGRNLNLSCKDNEALEIQGSQKTAKPKKSVEEHSRNNKNGNAYQNNRSKKVQAFKRQATIQTFLLAEAYEYKEKLEDVDPMEIKYKEKQKYLRVRQNINNYHAVLKCHRQAAYNSQPGLDRNHYVESGLNKSYYSGVHKCNSMLCPVCLMKHQEQQRQKIALLCKRAKKEGLETHMLTLTMKHKKTDELNYLYDMSAVMLKDFYNAWRGLKKQYGIKTWMKVNETMYNFVNGWHPHNHHLLITRKLTKDEKKELEQKLKKLWFRINVKHGLLNKDKMSLEEMKQVLKVNADIVFNCQPSNYLTKVGLDEDKYKEKKKQGQGVDFELAYSSTKKGRSYHSYSIMDIVDNEWKLLFLEYAKAIENRANYYFDKIAKQWIEEEKELEPKEKIIKQNIRRFKADEWLKIITVPEARPEFLHIANVVDDLEECRRCVDHYYYTHIVPRYNRMMLLKHISKLKIPDKPIIVL